MFGPLFFFSLFREPKYTLGIEKKMKGCACFVSRQQRRVPILELLATPMFTCKTKKERKGLERGSEYIKHVRKIKEEKLKLQKEYINHKLMQKNQYLCISC